MAIVNLKELRERAEYISEQKHPYLDLIIWNYTPKCQFGKKWDKYTTMCRGLITDLEGNIVARPFKKFFNWGEDLSTSIPTEMPIITEKLDGSLGILYFDRDIPFIATRGSFGSDQAKWATQWIQLKGNKDYLKNKTYLFEIIYPENRIVIDYQGRQELVLLAVIDIETGDETWRIAEDEAKRLGFSYAKKFYPKNLDDILKTTKTLTGNEEGYVFHWPNHNNLRVKLKGKEYVRLHKLLTEFSSIALWETLKEKESLEDILDDVPDEFYDWVKDTQKKLISEFDNLYERAKEGWLSVSTIATRKEQAEVILNQYGDIAGLIFSMLDGKDPSKAIWSRIRPKYEKSFAKDIDL